MDAQELEKRLNAQDEVLKKIASDTHKTKQYFLWTIIGSVVTFILPLIIAMIAIPFLIGPYLDTITSSIEGL